jgi:hypothetical protein
MQGMKLKNDFVIVQEYRTQKDKYGGISSKGDINNNGPSILHEINLEEEHVELVSCANISCHEMFSKIKR